MCKIRNVTIEVPLGTKIDKLISILNEIYRCYDNVTVASFDYDSIEFNVGDKDVAED